MAQSNRNQHYVPQFLLKNFVSGKKDQIHVYDKMNSSIFKTKVRNIAAERDFYNFNFQGEELTLEESITSIEDTSAKIINKIIAKRSLKEITFEELGKLCYFTALQFQRTKNMRKRVEGWDKLIQDKIIEMGGDINNVKGYKPFDDETLQEFNIKSMIQNIPKYSTMIALKRPILYQTRPGETFFISDDPVALFNTNDFGPYGNLGLLVPGVEIYLPLSHDLVVCFICPTIAEPIIKASEQMNWYLMNSPGELKNLKDPGHILNMANGFINGAPVSILKESLKHVNSIQAHNSHRYVFSQDGNFELIKEMASRKK